MVQNPAVVVVVGSINVDLIVRSERLPGPGETIVGGEFVEAGGGKGANQAVAARRLGADVRFIGRVGHDGPGDLALSNFVAEGLPTTWISVDQSSATGVALILVDQRGENMISVASGANLTLTSDDVRAAEAAFDGARVLLVQLEVPVETVQTALEIGRAHGLTTILNPAPARPVPDALLRLVDWATPNAGEAAAMTGLEVTDLPSAVRAAEVLRARGPSRVVVTLGAKGAVVVTSEGVSSVAPFPIRPVDSTAAGDAFSAGLAVGLARGLDSGAALRYASAAGALTTTRSGAQPSLPTEAQVLALLAANKTEPLADLSRG